MSQLCPICKKIKSKDSLFCDDCTKRIKTDFEVDVPESPHQIDINHQNDIEDEIIEPEIIDPDINDPDIIEKDTIIKETGIKNYTEPASTINAPNKYLTSDKKDSNKYTFSDKEPNTTNKKNKIKPWIWIGLILLILIASFFVYNETIREDNLERSSWETAMKTNSVEGYLSYIVKHPTGEHLEEAQEGLMKLKEQEASSWERMKETGSVSELRGFLEQYSTSPYIPLVKARYDSLSWVVALNTNTLESYSEYLLLTDNGDITGNYLSDAQSRYNMLYQSESVNSETLDSLRSTVSGFYSSLSALDHSGMYRYLAPHVKRFFDSGGASRERITGELLVTTAQAGGSRINFSPDLEYLQYERIGNDNFNVNIPVTKSYSENSTEQHVPGYISHIEINNQFQITAIYESKPFYGAP